MARLIKLGFEKGDVGYDLELNWDDVAFADNTIAFEVTASRYRLADPDKRLEVLSVSLSIDPRTNEPPVLVLSVGGKEVTKFPLESIVNEAQFIDRIPASMYSLVFGGDPITGCLIRSGLSASIGQLIECKNESTGLQWVRPRMSAIGRCMREHIPQMGARMAFRAAKCVFVVGME
jgi:hypothetical protein